MEIKMNRDQVVANYGGDVEESGFVKAGIEAAILELAETVKGWHEYDVVKIDNAHGDQLTIYTLDLVDEQRDTIATAYVTIRGTDEEVLIELGE